MRKIRLLVALILCALLLVSCNGTGAERFDLSAESESASEINKNFCTVHFADGGADIDGAGARFEGSTLTVFRGGEYTLSGELGGNIIVDVPKSEKVHIVMADLGVYSTDTSALYIKSADKVTLDAAEGTNNTLVDGEEYAREKGAEPSACVYSADDIEICGSGKLSVIGNSKNGIESKNDVRISGAVLQITAARNAVKGKDSVRISAGEINITKCYDGLKSDNEKEAGRGIVEIVGGRIEMDSEDDGIQAYNSVSITGGEIYMTCKGKDINCDGEISVADGIIK